MTFSTLLSTDTLNLVQRKRPGMMAEERAGKRSISASLITPPDSNASSRSSSSSAASVSVTNWINVPVYLNSMPTFEFLGFTPAAAEKLFHDKCKKEQDVGVEIDLLAWAMDSVEYLCHAVEDDTDDWVGSMSQAGIQDSIIQAMMKEQHKAIRLTQKLSNWLAEMIDTQYLVLMDMNDKIQANLDNEGPKLRGGHSEEPSITPAPPGHIALYKSVERRRCDNTIFEDGTIKLRSLESMAPTDFARRGGLYFTDQLWVASHYAALIRDICSVADRRVLEMHVPIVHLEEVKIWSLAFEDDDFKQLVYCCRRDQDYSRDISRKRAAHGLIKGPIAHGHSKSFSKMKSWQDITESHVLKNKHTMEISRQYVWVKKNYIRELELVVAGKCFLRRPSQGLQLLPEPWNDSQDKGTEMLV
ncbi:hypothetical protein J1614_002757 [Plenodomus biglobosus]|nr:hypothetical protein J1614_002757 [Plenodomus biglobosus]